MSANSEKYSDKADVLDRYRPSIGDILYNDEFMRQIYPKIIIRSNFVANDVIYWGVTLEFDFDSKFIMTYSKDFIPIFKSIFDLTIPSHSSRVCIA
jgi:hypothetical protein